MGIRGFVECVAISLTCLLVVGCPVPADHPDETVAFLDGEAGRWIPLEGASNTRDIGGYVTAEGRTVRRGLVYRSGELTSLTSLGCEAFAQLGIRRVVDFRNRLAPSPLFGGDAPCVFQVSAMTLLPVINDATEIPVQRYVQAVADNADSYRRALELIGDPENLPLLYHCAAGKDRTGIMTVLLLALLDVDRETIVADYELSDLVAPPVSTDCVIELLDEIERQGGIAAYLANIGVTDEVRAGIRAALLE